MQLTDAPLAGVVLVELKVLGDARGFFVERFQLEAFEKAGLDIAFLQDNHSRSAPGVLRGLHYQADPPQGKLVGVTRGRIWDVAVDIRPESPTFGQSYAVELSDLNGRLLWVPAGFAHGFCVLGDEPADVLYKVDAYYNPSGEGGVSWCDPDLAIAWPLREPLVSERDRKLPSFASYRERHVQWDLVREPGSKLKLGPADLPDTAQADRKRTHGERADGPSALTRTQRRD
jgi:dTDP-4-dehydrorhamnose 3,5-epimerase